MDFGVVHKFSDERSAKMKCQKCGKYLLENMSFCPYCGEKTDINGECINTENSLGEENEIVQNYCQQDDYYQVFQMAAEGSNIAKGYYMKYRKRNLVGKSSEFDSKEFKDMFTNYYNEGNLFAKTVRGYNWYYRGMEGIAGIIRDTASCESGAKDIVEAAMGGEEAAMTIVAEWIIKGNEYAPTKDQVKAIRYILKAAENRYPRAMYLLGLWKMKGQAGITSDKEVGIELIEEAAFLGESNAIALLCNSDNRWLDDELKHIMAEDKYQYIADLMLRKPPMKAVEDIEEVLQKLEIRHPDIKEEQQAQYHEEEQRANDLISGCKGLDDYIEAYKTIQSMNFICYDSKPILKWISMAVRIMTGDPIENADEIYGYRANRKEIFEFIDSLTEPEQYLALQGKIDSYQPAFPKAVEKEIKDYASKKIASECKDTLLQYQTYTNCEMEKVKIVVYWVGIGMGTILALVLLLFIPIVSIVLFGGMAVLAIRFLGKFSRLNKKMKESEKAFRIVDILQRNGFEKQHLGIEDRI